MAEIDRLIIDIQSHDRSISEKAAEAMRSLLNKTGLVEKLLRQILESMESPTDPSLGALSALSMLREDSRISSLLLAELRSQNPQERIRAAWALKNLPQEASVKALKRAASTDSNAEVRIWSLHALRVLSLNSPGLESDLFEIYASAVRHKDSGVRHAAFECISRVKGEKYDSLLELASQDTDDRIKENFRSWTENRPKNNE